MQELSEVLHGCFFRQTSRQDRQPHVYFYSNSGGNIDQYVRPFLKEWQQARRLKILYL
ncbi:hypothetical protein MUP35_00395 [Patescibacteria group bacterium]|nr:hypothetical protein [Patescibacteria group bacterium]